MDIATLYSLRANPRPALSDAIRTIISTLKISFKPSFRRQVIRRAPAEEASNWRELALLAVHRKVREKDDADYDAVNAFLNKLTKQTYDKMMVSIMEKLDSRDSMFRIEREHLHGQRLVRAAAALGLAIRIAHGLLR